MNRRMGLVFLLLAFSRAEAAGYRAMQCAIVGCTDGEVRMTEGAGDWLIEFYQMFYLTNPILDDMGDFLKKAGQIGVNDRVDYMVLDMRKEDCTENRAVGGFVCRGTAEMAYVRVRENERYIEGERGYDFTWKTLGPTDAKPWKFEVRKQLTAGSHEWLMSVTDGSVSADFWTVPLEFCRYDE